MEGKMKVITFYDKGDVRLDTVDIPKIGPDDVLLKSKLVSVCGSDMHPYNVGARMASIPNERGGHEYAAEIVEVGENVTKYQVGDRVLGFNMAFCGECWYCKHGDFGHCKNVIKKYTGRGLPGAFAQYFTFYNPEDPNAFAPYLNSLYKVPDDMTDVQIALAEPFGVGLGAVETADVKEGQKVVILGAGIIGISAMQFAKLRGAEVTIVDVSRRRLECAKELGADHVIDNSNGDCYEQIAKYTEETGFSFGKETLAIDTVIDCAGYPGSFNDSIKMVKCGGTVCAVAFYEDESPIYPFYITMKDMRIVGSSACDLLGAIDAIRNGSVKVEPLVDDIVPVDRYMEAYKRQIDASAVKVLINMEQ
jgi:threonine dehydrogenase-like Zn-dependent dehydrogenase